MKRIDINVLKSVYQDISMKRIQAIEKPELVKEFFKYIDFNNNIFEKKSAYDIASILNSYNDWYVKKDKEPKSFNIRPGDIFCVELGCFNVKYEMSYIHTCIVLKKIGYTVLIVPGSSKKYKKNNFLIEDIEKGDGFKENTGVLIDQSKFVSINRIVGSRLGMVSKETLKRVENKFLEVCSPNKYNKLKLLEKENNDLKEEIIELKKKLENK
jgi:mRNA-degrading endonuclease toxin of MazEF toxin-antitoxin module